MAEPFASLNDYIALTGKTLTESEQERVTLLLVYVSDRLRQYALNSNQDLDQMLESGKVLESVARNITIDIVARTVATAVDVAPMTQYSQSALGYSVSGTYLNAGGGIYIKGSELKALGLNRQRYGFVDLYDKRNNSNTN